MKAIRASRIRTAAVAAVVLGGLAGGCGGADDVTVTGGRGSARPVVTVHDDVKPTAVPPTSVQEPRPQPVPQADEAPTEAADAGEPAPAQTTEPVVEEPPAPAGELTTHGGPVADHVSLVDNLRRQGLTVIPSSTINQPFLSAPVTILDLGGPGIGAASIQSGDYQSSEAAMADMSRLVGGGSEGERFGIMWTGPPHFFLKERAFVIYVGSDGSVLSLLGALLGSEVVGGQA